MSKKKKYNTTKRKSRPWLELSSDANLLSFSGDDLKSALDVFISNVDSGASYKKLIDSVHQIRVEAKSVLDYAQEALHRVKLLDPKL